MRFEASTRIRTSATEAEVLRAVASAFRKVAGKVVVKDGVVRAKGVEQSFGSINRADDTVARVREAEGGYLLTAEVHYRPSFWFWLFLLLLLFTWVGWLIPIVFYLIQKASVRTSVDRVLERVKNEFDAGLQGYAGPPTAPSLADELEKLADLRDRGVLTDDEFAARKRAILGQPAGDLTPKS